MKTFGDQFLQVVIKLASDGDKEGRKNSIISSYMARESDVVRKQKRDKVLYMREEP